MTIDEAIQHARERAITQREEMCYECAEEHEQLADWLEELKELRKFKQQVDKIRQEEHNKAIDDVLKLNKHNHYNMYNEIMYQSIKVSDIEQLKG